ncbi:MAG: hypothetical protein JSR86_12240 [Proteobacteria bacterium]|nr:hypothetical protein [Pseudomonadota bacterium]
MADTVSDTPAGAPRGPDVFLAPQPLLRIADVIAVSSPFGVAPADPRDLVEAQDLATRLMEHKVASLETYLRVQVIQPAAVLVAKEAGRVTGVAGMLFLRRAGVEQILAGAFDALDPADELLTHEGESPVALYAWGVAAATKLGGQAILGGGRAVRLQLFPTITGFTRAVTGAGRHVALTRYGYRPLRHPDDDLMVSEPTLAAERAA